MSPRFAFLLAPALLLACGGEGPLTLRSRGGDAGAAGVAGAGDGLAGAGPVVAGAGGSLQSGGSAGTGGGAGVGGSGGSGQAGDGGSGGAPIRTVSQRNPFGNVAASDNLLWDGDFEWSGAFIQQYSWSSGKSWSTQGAPGIGVYAQCRSGMKCAQVKKSGAIGGMAVSPRTPMTAIRGWARVGEGNACAKVSLYLSSCFENDSLVKPAAATTVDPDADGWCRYEDERPTLDKTPCVFIINKAKNEVFVDDIYLGPGTTKEPSSALKATAEDLDATKMLQEIREDFRRHRRGDERPAARPPSSFPRVRQAPR